MASETPVPIWEYVPLEAYLLPAAPVITTARRRLASLWRQLRARADTAATPVMSQEMLTQLPDWQLRRAAPPPDWIEPSRALDVALLTWTKASTARRSDGDALRLIVTPPHLNGPALLKAWADRHGWRIIDPPSPEQVMSGGEAWLQQQFGVGSPWLLPSLERLFLRHAEGLDLLRRFLDVAHTGTLGQGLIGCDSWAWAFVGHVWKGWITPPSTLQALSGSALARALRSLADGGGAKWVRFRQADDGSDVLQPPDADQAEDYETSFLHELAAYSRGNLGVAWAIWRTALRSEPDSNLVVVEDVEAQIPGRTVWVTPWSALTLPSLPAQPGQAIAFVLHALLLHGGLPVPLLVRLLPLAPGEITEALDRLWAAGLVAREEAVWRVSATGYPAVRAFLRTNDYLTDAL